MGDRRGVLKDEAEAVRWFRLAAESSLILYRSTGRLP